MNKQRLLHWTKKMAALGAAAVLTAASAFSGSVQAENPGTDYKQYDDTTTIGGTTTMTFHKYFVMDRGLTVPKVTFNYTIKAGTYMAASFDGTGAIENVEVLAGINPDKITWNGNALTWDAPGSQAKGGTIAFTNADTVEATAPATGEVKDKPATPADIPYDHTTQQVVKQAVTLDFSKCGFTEPGIYRYVLTEDTTAQTGVVFDPNPVRVIDVYVEDISTSSTDGSTGAVTWTKELEIKGYVLHASQQVVNADSATYGSAQTQNDIENKSQGYTNWFDSQDLHIANEVDGNQASKDKYFKYTLKLTAAAGTTYSVDLSGADASVPSPANSATDASYAGLTNPATITIGADGTATVDFYLQHNQEVVIKGLTQGVTYEVSVTEEDYKKTAKAGHYNGTLYDDKIAGTVGADDLKTSYLLSKSGVIPTGVILTVAPFAGITLLGAAGIFGVTRRKKKEDDEA